MRSRIAGARVRLPVALRVATSIRSTIRMKQVGERDRLDGLVWVAVSASPNGRDGKEVHPPSRRAPFRALATLDPLRDICGISGV